MTFDEWWKQYTGDLGQYLPDDSPVADVARKAFADGRAELKQENRQLREHVGLLEANLGSPIAVALLREQIAANAAGGEDVSV